MKANHHDLGVCTDLDVIDRYLDVSGLFVVEAGCGNMALSKALATRGASVLAIDPDPVQAAKNEQADIIPNVGFAQTGAQSIPVEPGSVDGVLFPYSLHHVPADLFGQVFQEVTRVLKNDGFLYVLEPVAAGQLNEITRLFHDEASVRAAAQDALDTFAMPLFQEADVIDYRVAEQFASWDEYATRYSNKSYNTNYTEAQVRDEAVKQRFLKLGEPIDFKFESPMRVSFFRKLKPGVPS